MPSLTSGRNRIAKWSGIGVSKIYLWSLDLSGATRGAGVVGGLLPILDVGASDRHYPTYDGNGNVGESNN
ncbi:MAG: hypothetical protein J0M04_00495 [Verrucomicrobia bacterium]|nr:hypothetical protein [Verrucomicrobiota bacterium]